MRRSRRELSNEYLLAKFGFDTAENEHCKVCPLSADRSPRFDSWDTRITDLRQKALTFVQDSEGEVHDRVVVADKLGDKHKLEVERRARNDSKSGLASPNRSVYCHLKECFQTPTETHQNLE